MDKQQCDHEWVGAQQGNSIAIWCVRCKAPPAPICPECNNPITDRTHGNQKYHPLCGNKVDKRKRNERWHRWVERN